MPDRFDLLKVEYIDTNTRGLCYAPYGKVLDGDTVETAFGRAFVVDRETYVSNDNPYILMIKDLINIPRVLFKITPIEYEEDA